MAAYKEIQFPFAQELLNLTNSYVPQSIQIGIIHHKLAIQVKSRLNTI